MEVLDRNPKDLVPYPGNPRLNDAGVEAVARSIQKFGFRQPIVVDEHGVIVVGHTRHKAALRLGLETAPVHVAAGLTEAQLRAYRIADNQTATLSDWDNDKLARIRTRWEYRCTHRPFRGFQTVPSGPSQLF